MTDLDALEKLALAATPGPWVGADGTHEIVGVGDTCAVWSDAEPVDEHADAAYIAAANPAAILALIRELRAAREVVEHLRFHADDGCFECHYARVAYHRAKEGA